MAIRALCLQDCDRLNAARAAVALHTDTAVEWFTDDTGDVLGAIAYHAGDLEWSWVVLRRDGRGPFRALARDTGLSALDDARSRLVHTMAAVVTTGEPMSAPDQPHGVDHAGPRGRWSQRRPHAPGGGALTASGSSMPRSTPSGARTTGRMGPVDVSASEVEPPRRPSSALRLSADYLRPTERGQS
jgi:hypothetical protein